MENGQGGVSQALQANADIQSRSARAYVLAVADDGTMTDVQMIQAQ